MTGRKVPVEYGPRRAGDAIALWANPGHARRTLGWEAKYTDPEPIIRTAWNWFEKHPDGSFKPPADYPRRSIATVTTHDLPTLRGYWTASDIELRRRLSLYPNDATCEFVREERVRDRTALLAALASQGLAHGSGGADAYGDELADAIHVYLARTASALVVLQAEDLAGMADPVNVPGTSDEHANWQRKMTVDLADVFRSDRIRQLFARVNAERQR